jgi:hypothetical protein
MALADASPASRDGGQGSELIQQYSIATPCCFFVSRASKQSGFQAHQHRKLDRRSRLGVVSRLLMAAPQRIVLLRCREENVRYRVL